MFSTCVSRSSVRHPEARLDHYWERALPHRMTLSWLSDEVMGSDIGFDDLTAIECPTLVTKGSTTEAWEKRVVNLIGGQMPGA